MDEITFTPYSSFSLESLNAFASSLFSIDATDLGGIGGYQSTGDSLSSVDASYDLPDTLINNAAASYDEEDDFSAPGNAQGVGADGFSTAQFQPDSQLKAASDDGLLSYANSQPLQTGADIARQSQVAEKPVQTEKNSVMELLNSKGGAAIAGQLISGLLGGIGTGAATEKQIKANKETTKERIQADKDLLDQKYAQQLDYVAKMRGAGTISRETWKPILKGGLLGQA